MASKGKRAEADEALGDLHSRLFNSHEIVLPTEYTVDDVIEEAQSPGFRENEQYQVEVMCRAQSLWKAFTSEQQETFAVSSIPHLQRFHQEEGGDTQGRWRLLQQIMRLADDSAVRSALAYCPDDHKPYEPESWEEGYTNLPGFVGRFVDCFKESTHPTPFFAWAAIGLIGMTCKWNVYTPLGGEDLMHNFYVFFVGQKGGGKSYAAKCVRTVMHRLNARLNTPIRVSGIDEPMRYQVMNRPDLWLNSLPQDGSMESIVEMLHRIRQIPIQEVRTAPDSGLQHLASTKHTRSASGCLFVDEVSEQFAKDDWHSSKKIAAYTSMATSDYRERVTLTRGDRSYDQQAFSMMVCGAVEWFRGAVSPALLEGGFMDRALFIYRKPTKRIYTALEVPTIDPLAVERLAEDLVPLAVAPTAMRRPVALSEGARDELIRLSREEFSTEKDREGFHPALCQYHATAIRREHAKIKVAACLAIGESLGLAPSDEPLEILPITVEHVRLADWLITSEDKYFSEFMAEVNVNAFHLFFRFIHQECREQQWEWMRASDLFMKSKSRAALRIKRKSDFDEAMWVLYASGLVDDGTMPNDPQHHRQPGKRAKAWRGVNSPELWKKFTR